MQGIKYMYMYNTYCNKIFKCVKSNDCPEEKKMNINQYVQAYLVNYKNCEIRKEIEKKPFLPTSHKNV